MSIVGIIANPASGKDIRRLVAHALVIGNREKANIVSRMLVGLHAAGVRDVRIMPDTFGIGRLATRALLQSNPEVASGVSVVDMDVSGTDRDTIRAAEMMQEMGVGCIITLGGDGTVRLVAKGCGNVPVLPVSTGTNNVLPGFVDGTIAGLCAGFVAQNKEVPHTSLCYRSKTFDVEVNGEVADTALVDVAAHEGIFVGARAVWDPAALRQIAVTQGAPTSIGLSSIVGMLHPISVHDPFGAVVTVSQNRAEKSVVAPIGPGLVSDIPIKDFTILQPGHRHPIVSERPLMLALDGERQIALKEGEDAAVLLREDGPWIVDVDRVMQVAVSDQYFTD